MVTKKVQNTNDQLAAWATRRFGSMWMFYAFFLYGLLPTVAMFAPYQATLLYWSNWVQLWSLPLLMVGGIVLSREGEQRDQETHDMVMQELKEIRRMHTELCKKFGICE